MTPLLAVLEAAAARRGESLPCAVRHHLLEGLLRRIAQLPDGGGLVLRGGLLTRAWVAPRPRPTRDLDVLAVYPFDIEETRRRFEAALATPADDGIVFANPVVARGIWLESAFPGVRLTLRLGLGAADQELTVDVGFGDPLIPEAYWLDYPAMLPEPPLRVLACRPETMVAWKLHGLAEMGPRWRPKDLADLWIVTDHVSLSPADLPPAIEAAFVSRGYTTADASNVLSHPQWATKTARVRWATHSGDWPPLSQVVAEVCDRLAPAFAELTHR